MVLSTRIRHWWDTREYADIVAVRYEHGRLLVAFMDGSEASLAVADLEGYGVEDREWQGARPEVHHITVPTRSGVVEIPWDVIRALTDREFGAFLTEHAASTAKRAGARFRDLRNARGLETSQVAQRVGVPSETIDRLEAGSLPADLDLEQRVLAALGTTRDQEFPVEPPEPSTQG
jgi:DNA-binding XRE family transcriptional regulator